MKRKRNKININDCKVNNKEIERSFQLFLYINNNFNEELAQHLYNKNGLKIYEEYRSNCKLNSFIFYKYLGKINRNKLRNHYNERIKDYSDSQENIEEILLKEEEINKTINFFVFIFINFNGKERAIDLYGEQTGEHLWKKFEDENKNIIKFYVRLDAVNKLILQRWYNNYIEKRKKEIKQKAKNKNKNKKKRN